MIMKETTLKKKIQRIRKKLRLGGVLPAYGGELNEEQQLIWDQIKKGDFTYWEEFRKNKFHIKKMKTVDYVCKICGENDMFNFYPKNRSKCKICISREMKKKYKNGDFTNRLESHRNWKFNNYIHHKVQAAKYRADKKGFEFTITDEIVEDILKQQNGKCYFTNTELTFNVHDWNSLSIDRINNDLGYIKENIVLVTKFVNSSKNSQTNQEFIDNIKQCYLGLINNGHLS